MAISIATARAWGARKYLDMSKIPPASKPKAEREYSGPTLFEMMKETERYAKRTRSKLLKQLKKEK